MADRLYTTVETDEILSGLRFETKLEKFVLARIAFSVSVALDGKDVPRSTDFSGAEVKRPTFIASDELFFKTILSYVHKKKELTEDEFYSNKSLIKDHIDNGSKHLTRIFKESNHNAELFLKKITDMVQFSGRKEVKGTGLDIFIGKTLLDKKDQILELNNTSKHANSHLAIMGKPGVGKTQFLLKILADIRTQSNYQTNFIFFDYKGDVVDNQKFLDIAKVQPYRLLQGNQTLRLISLQL